MDKAIFVMGILGAVCIAIYIIPQMVKTLKSKNTSGVSLIMFIFSLLGSLFFTIMAIFEIVAGLDVSAWIGVFIGNVCSTTCGAIVLSYKLHHVIKAKKLGITEVEYCERLAKALSSIKKEEKRKTK